MTKKLEAFEMLRQGGGWLGQVRAWMQIHKRNGSTVTWGSGETLGPAVTVRELEEVAAISAAAAVNESDAGKLLGTFGALLDTGVFVQKEGLSGEEQFQVGRFMRELGRYRSPETETEKR